MVRVEKQLSIFLANRPGGLAKVCGTLAEADIN
ncbi:MAG: ACT domain-containing protein, partial [Planctomycetes bacterium]|nr:ACT domain-containing protein [Planctomycetota bacterium]